VFRRTKEIQNREHYSPHYQIKSWMYGRKKYPYALGSTSRSLLAPNFLSNFFTISRGETSQSLQVKTEGTLSDGWEM
jgi:hypothetical protein